MILLNKDDKNLKIQADNIVKNLSKYQDKNALFYSVNVWYEFMELLDIESDAEIEFPFPSIYSEARKWQSENSDWILQNVNTNINYCQNFYQLSASKCAIISHDVYDKMLNRKNSPIDYGKYDMLDILYNFFREEDPVLKELFEQICREGNLYYRPQMEGVGCYLYNNNEKTHNIFLADQVMDVAFLDILLHELGHAIDHHNSFSYYEKKSIFSLFYGSKYMYNEIYSQLYSLKLLNFLIQNNILKEEAEDVLFNHYADLFDECTVFGELDGNFSFSSSIGLGSPFFTDLPYSYGFAIANSLFLDPSLKENFKHIQYEEFCPSKIEQTGLTLEHMTKSVVDNAKTFFKV